MAIKEIKQRWIVSCDCCGTKRETTTRQTPMDWASAPFDELLPVVARLCHNAYDAPMRRAGIKSRAKSQMAIGDFLA